MFKKLTLIHDSQIKWGNQWWLLTRNIERITIAATVWDLLELFNEMRC